jgi:site-specific DNA-cytosine methylase
MENVPLAATSGRFEQFLLGLERLGYCWTAAVVNAVLWGSCQSRQRLVLVAAKEEIGAVPAIPTPTHGGSGTYYNYSRGGFCKITADPVGMLGRAPATQRAERNLPHTTGLAVGTRAVPTVAQIIGDLPPIDAPRSKRLGHKAWGHSRTILKRMEKVEEGKRWRGGADHFSQAYGRLHRRGLARTITGYFSNAGSGRYWHPTENRALSLREAARIQGFPDSFQFGDNDSENCTLVGNALDSSLSKLIYRVIRATLEA